jgi:4-hydroxy-tetrahydrodipicolinate synthase
MATTPARLRGLYVPLVTPFDERDAVDVTALERLAAAALDDGAAGVVALGTTGEASALRSSERDEVVAACSRVCAARGAELVVGAGTNDTRTTVERHEALADVPAAAASLVVVPYYVRPSEAGIVGHVRAVAERSPVPLIVYNVPYRTARGLGAEALLELAATENVAGVKQAVDGLDADTLTVLAGTMPWDAATRRGFSVLAGDDPFVLPTIVMGATGAIAASSGVDTAEFVAMVEDGLAGRLGRARARAGALLGLTRALFAEPNPAVLKALLFADGRIPTPDVRPPLTGCSPEAARAAQRARVGRARRPGRLAPAPSTWSR